MDRSYVLPEIVELYDLLNTGHADHNYYAKLAAHSQGPVMELGCGTGAALLYIVNREKAETWPFVGIDPAPQMLAIARSKAEAERVTWVEGVLSDFESQQRFDLIFMTGHAFQCLLSDEEITDTFRAALRLLSPEGIFAFETRNPLCAPWENWRKGSHTDVTIVAHNGESVRVWQEVQEIRAGFVTFDQHHHFIDQDRIVSTRSTLRFLKLDEVRARAEEAGLALKAVHGDWSGKPFEETDKEIILQLVPASA